MPDSNQEIEADRKHPGREDQGHPQGKSNAQQQYQRQRIGHERPATVHQAGAQPDGAQRDHEDAGHANGIDVDDVKHHRAAIGEDAAFHQCGRCGRVAAQQPAGQGCAHERQGQKHQAAAQEDGRKKAIFQIAKPVANHADEPQKGDSGVGHQFKAREIRPALLSSQTPASAVGSAGIERRMSARLAP